MTIWPKRAGGRTVVTVASLPWTVVEPQQRADVDVGDAVAVRRHEHRVVAQPARRCASGGRRSACSDPVSTRWTFQRGALPSWTVVLAAGQVDRDAVVERVEVQEVLLDDLRPVAERDDELVDAVARRRCSGCARGSACRRSRPSASVERRSPRRAASRARPPGSRPSSDVSATGSIVATPRPARQKPDRSVPGSHPAASCSNRRYRTLRSRARPEK